MRVRIGFVLAVLFLLLGRAPAYAQAEPATGLVADFEEFKQGWGVPFLEDPVSSNEAGTAGPVVLLPVHNLVSCEGMWATYRGDAVGGLVRFAFLVGREDTPFEVTYTRPDGTIRWFTWNDQCIADQALIQECRVGSGCQVVVTLSHQGIGCFDTGRNAVPYRGTHPFRLSMYDCQ